MNQNPSAYQIAIVGGGAAGFFAALCSAQRARETGKKIDITIFESSHQYLKKVRISGGGRCNVTHHCYDVKSFCQNYPRGGRELLSPMQRFQARDTVEWFKSAGVDLVAEADGRMFPSTNTSESIIDCYMDLVESLGINLQPKKAVKVIQATGDKRWDLRFADGSSFITHRLLIATGSSPGGYQLAESLGHRITERAPSLFSFKITDPLLTDLQGLSFPNSSLKLILPDRKTFKQKGPILITHWGLSGPAILKLSAWAAREMKRSGYQGRLLVNWLGVERPDEVEDLLVAIKTENSKSLIKNVYPTALPKRFWLSLLESLSLASDKQWANISKKELAKLVQILTAGEFQIQGQNRFKDEFVECGGVKLSEVDFRTMESKICQGIYFAGEILDIDGITGGFNFQNAWTGGWIAAQHMVDQAGQ